MRVAAAVLVCVGCNAVFGVKEVKHLPDAAGDAPPDVDCAAIADEDGDCVADMTDNCPAVANAGQEDGDSDGVGNTCDPHPMDPHDKLLGFFSFLGDGAADMAAWPNEDSASTTWSYPGDGRIVHTDTSDTVGEVLSADDYISSELTVEAGFTFHQWQGATSATSMVVWLDSPMNVGGYDCFATSYNNNSPTSDLLVVQDSGGFTTTSANLPEIHDGDRITLRFRRTTTPAELACHASVNDSQVDSPVTPIVMTAGSGDHHVGIQARFTSAEVRYVVIYGRTI
jgi:hypothetical protein